MTASKPLRDRVFGEDEPVRLSICTIAFNHEAYIEECLEGFLDQVCDFRVEIIVHDDASVDGTAEILRAYADKYPTIIRLILQPVNLFSKGVNPYYSYVFPIARGEYIAICDGDDFWDDPSKIATQVRFLDCYLDVAITYGPVKQIVHNGERPDFRNGLERDLTAHELKLGLPINTLTTCFRNVFQAEPPQFLKSAPMGDMTIWAVLGHHGRGVYLCDLKPAGYREHDGGIFSLQTIQTQLFMGTITLLTMAAYHHVQGDRGASRACLKRVVGQIVMLNGGSATVKEALRKAFSLFTKRLRGRKG
mgnify:CR=1 FL=1